MTADARPVLVMLHALGGSARSWDAVIAKLDGFDCVPLDLPGFGDAAMDGALTVEQIADHVVRSIRAHAPPRWMLVGHSMGGKIAAIVARRAEQGEEGLAGLAGVVLLAASPPSPEPMEEERRRTMIGWAADGPISEDHARVFVEQNVAGELPPTLGHAAIEEVMRSGRHAWLGWLERGAFEDWSGFVDVLHTPALIVAGREDGDLGVDAQRRLNASHYADARIETIADAAHLLPLERPDAIAALILGHWRAVGDRVTIPAAYARLLASDRVGARTRGVLLDRARPDDPDYAPVTVSPRQLAVLRALLDRVLPQDAPRIDLAARIDTLLAEGMGDGWRFADLPADADAYRCGLDTLDALADGDFAALAPERQDGWLARLADGKAGLGDTGETLSPVQMKLWFEDVRADAVRIWLSHPASLARIGYDGFANGGDGVRKQGFLRTHADDAEAWEPAPARTATR